MGTECTELFLIHSLLVWSASASCISVNSDIILSCVQVQRRFRGHTLGSLFHDHLSSTLFAFSGIFLVNYILLSSAVDESKTTMAINFQDARQLMNQVFTNPVAPIVLLVILLFSGHIVSMTCIIGSEVISENLFGIKLPLFADRKSVV